MHRASPAPDPAHAPVAGDTGERRGPGPELRHLLAGMPERLRGRPLPRVVAVTVSSRSVGLLLGERRPDPAEGFDAIDTGLTWLIDRSALDAPPGPPARGTPWPLLVSLGRLRSDGSLVLGNLEEFGTFEAIGEPADVRMLAESLTAELAADHFGGRARLICVDSGTQFADLDRVRVVESSREALVDAELHRARVRNTGARRAPPGESGAPGALPPLVVIDPHARDHAIRRRIRSLAGPGLAVVTAGAGRNPAPGGNGRSSPDRGWVFEVTGRRLRWEPVGVDLELGHAGSPAPSPAHSTRDGAPAVLAVRPANTIAGSAGHAGTPRRVGRPVSGAAPCPGIDGYGWTGGPPDARPGAGAAGVTPGPVEVQVLGVVQAVGVSAPFRSLRALDLACFLAFHRDGATADLLRHWLWCRSEPVPSRKAFANVVSRARVCLGRDHIGDPYLSRVGADGVYRLSAAVTTDVERFSAWRRLAEREPPRAALERLLAALWLVRGAPFGGGRDGTFSWADASWRSHVEYLVDSTAHGLANLALELGCTDVARWATLRGLAVTPDCEQCLQRRITAARRSGHRREADLVLRALDRRELEPVPGFDDPAPLNFGRRTPADDLTGAAWRSR